ncbi:MAG: transporter, family, oxalate/formate antiporter [Desulfuromonadales bacterium]|jgi:hypothetical protein|nr:transporter, family, oxalate/formate antiporter [Desulfuromonadales bacterium]
MERFPKTAGGPVRYQATQSSWPYMLFLCFYALAMPFAGGLTSGLIKDHFGSYQYAFYVTAAMALAGIAINLLAIPRKALRTPA